MRSPKRFEWVKMNLDTGAAANTFTLNFGPEGAGNGRFYRIASGEWILVELSSFKDTTKTECLSLNGRLAGAHTVLCSATEIACKGKQVFVPR